MPTSMPTARRADLNIQEVNGELLVYDTVREQASVMNRTAAVIWNLADGTSSVDDIARLATQQLAASVDTAMVWYTLEQLSKKHLLQTEPVTPVMYRGMTRRNLLRAGAVGAAVALPVVVSLTVPSVSLAASCVEAGQPCTTPSECCSNTCTADTCA